MVCVWDAGDHQAWLLDAPAVGREHLQRGHAEGGDLVLAGVEVQPAGGGDHHAGLGDPAPAGGGNPHAGIVEHQAPPGGGDLLALPWSDQTHAGGAEHQAPPGGDDVCHPPVYDWKGAQPHVQP